MGNIENTISQCYRSETFVLYMSKGNMLPNHNYKPFKLSKQYFSSVYNEHISPSNPLRIVRGLQFTTTY